MFVFTLGDSRKSVRLQCVQRDADSEARRVAVARQQDVRHERYKRLEDEGRTLMQSALAGPADLVVTDTELRVILPP